jgi:hypothetical protein
VVEEGAGDVCLEVIAVGTDFVILRWGPLALGSSRWVFCGELADVILAAAEGDENECGKEESGDHDDGGVVVG